MKPRLIIHGGAGNITRENLSPDSYALHRRALLRIVRAAWAELLLADDGGITTISELQDRNREDNITAESTPSGRLAGYSASASAALNAATLAVKLLEDCPLFNAARGAVFTRSGTNELEASVMLAPGVGVGSGGSESSGGSKKRSAAVSLLRRVRNPILLAREMLLRGDRDMEPADGLAGAGDDDAAAAAAAAAEDESAHGHCHLSGDEAERLARAWGVQTVEPTYFWTRKRWEQHRRGIGKSPHTATHECHPSMPCLCHFIAGPGDAPKSTHDQSLSDSFGEAKAQTNALDGPNPCDWNIVGKCDASMPCLCHFVQKPRSLLDPPADWSNEDNAMDEPWDGIEYLPQGTVGAVALDSSGTLCVATSTGGLTNKSPGRIGDTPSAGAGYWAEKYNRSEEVSLDTDEIFAHPQDSQDERELRLNNDYDLPSLLSSTLSLSPLGSAIRSCLSIRQTIFPASPDEDHVPQGKFHPCSSTLKYRGSNSSSSIPIRAVAVSGTGNGDSFIRCCAAHDIARRAFLSGSRRLSSRSNFFARAVRQVAGQGGVLQRSAGRRWGKGTGEGEGGVIGIGIEYYERDGGLDKRMNEKSGQGRVFAAEEVCSETVAEFNCGGMFRAWIDEGDEARMMVFHEEYR